MERVWRELEEMERQQLEEVARKAEEERKAEEQCVVELAVEQRWVALEALSSQAGPSMALPRQPEWTPRDSIMVQV